MTIREELISTGAIRPRRPLVLRDGHNPTSKSRIEHPNVFKMDAIGKAAAAKHLAEFRSGHGDAEHRDEFDARPVPRGR